MANTFDWVEIKTADIKRAATFYENVFGWKVMHKDTTEGFDYWIFDTGDVPRVENLRRGGLWLRPAGADLGAVVYVVVDSIDRVLEQVTALGGKVIAAKTPQGPAFRAYFADPDGNVLGLWEDRDLA